MADLGFPTRRATLEDAPLIADLGARTFRDAFAADNDPADMERYLAETFSISRIENELEQPGSIFLLAYDPSDEARPVAYARLLGGSEKDCVRGPSPVELVRLYVESEARSRGCGSALIRTCLDIASEKGFETMWLGVWEQNRGARRFYRRWGFEEVGTHPFVLGSDRQTDVIMARSLRRDT